MFTNKAHEKENAMRRKVLSLVHIAFATGIATGSMAQVAAAERQMVDNKDVHPTWAASDTHVLGECRIVNVGDVEEGYGVSGLAPVSTADIFFRGSYAKKVDWQAATVTVIEKPQHGDVEIATSSLTGSLDAAYRSERNYTGNDALVLKVEGSDYSLEIHYFFRVVNYKSSAEEIFENPNCKAAEWTISATLPQGPHMLAMMR